MPTADLAVRIVSTPSQPPFPAASYISLECVVDTATPTASEITLSWQQYCSGDPVRSVKKSIIDSPTLQLQSSTVSCLDEMQCVAHGDEGVWGVSDVFEIGNTSGRLTYRNWLSS